VLNTTLIIAFSTTQLSFHSALIKMTYSYSTESTENYLIIRDVEAEAVEAVKFLWKRKQKHFEKRSWKRKRKLGSI